VSDAVQAWDALWESTFEARANEQALRACMCFAHAIAAFAEGDHDEGAYLLQDGADLTRSSGRYRSEAQAFGDQRTGLVAGRWEDDGGACV